MKKKNLIVMCGVPGAGKDTWIENNIYKINGTVNVVSRDKIRFSLLEDLMELGIQRDNLFSSNKLYFSKEKEVFKKFIEEISDSLKCYDITIANATHLNEASRSKLFRNISKELSSDINVTAMVIKTDLKTCLEHNRLRTGLSFVPEEQIKNMYSRFTIPILEEGFNDIIIYEKDKNNKIKYSFKEK